MTTITRFALMLLAVCTLGVSNSQAAVTINEVLADPPSGAVGDINADGERHSTQDEFVELYNSGSNAVDLSGWSLADSKKARHIFAEGTVIQPSGYLIVFGGGEPTGFKAAQVSSSGRLDLNNTGDIVELRNAAQETKDRFEYGRIGDRARSLVRSEAQSDPALHLPNGDGDAWSPGKANPTLEIES